jgi:deoxyribose-phosphate aldolase
MIDLKTIDRKSLAKVFDYAVLPKDTDEAAIRKGCAVTRQYEFAAFYSSSAYWTPIVKEELAGYPDIEIGTGIAFPFGSAPAAVKAFETEDAIQRGCTAVDMVMNIGALKDKRYDVVRDECELFIKAAGPAVTKVILEVNFLTDEQIAAACQILAETGVHYAKSSSGQFEGPSLEQFMIMKQTLLGTDVKLKVSGVKFPRPQNAFVFLLAGADRIGTRDAPAMVESLELLREIGMLPRPDKTFAAA